MAGEEGKETLLNKREEQYYYENCPGCKVDLHKAGQTVLPIKELFTIWVVVLGTALILYCVFALHDISYSEIFSLWAVTPRNFGGLSYSTVDVGEVCRSQHFLGTKRFDASILPGDQVVFFVLNEIEAIGVLLTFKPILVEKQNTTN